MISQFLNGKNILSIRFLWLRKLQKNLFKFIFVFLLLQITHCEITTRTSTVVNGKRKTVIERHNLSFKLDQLVENNNKASAILQMPTVQKVQQTIKAKNNNDAIAQQFGTYHQLMKMIDILSDFRSKKGKLTDKENSIYTSYQKAIQELKPPLLSTGKVYGKKSSKEEWDELRNQYETSDTYEFHVLYKYFSKNFRDIYYPAKRKYLSEKNEQDMADRRRKEEQQRLEEKQQEELAKKRKQEKKQNEINSNNTLVSNLYGNLKSFGRVRDETDVMRNIRNRKAEMEIYRINNIFKGKNITFFHACASNAQEENPYYKTGRYVVSFYVPTYYDSEKDRYESTKCSTDHYYGQGIWVMKIVYSEDVAAKFVRGLEYTINGNIKSIEGPRDAFGRMDFDHDNISIDLTLE